MSISDEARQWAARAERDLLLIHNEMNSANTPWELVAFHAQQAGEKYLKCLLVQHHGQAPRMHDLSELLESARLIDASVLELRSECALLNQYAVAPRYPSPKPDPTEEQARKAVASAERIRNVIRQRLGM